MYGGGGGGPRAGGECRKSRWPGAQRASLVPVLLVRLVLLVPGGCAAGAWCCRCARARAAPLLSSARVPVLLLLLLVQVPEPEPEQHPFFGISFSDVSYYINVAYWSLLLASWLGWSW